MNVAERVGKWVLWSVFFGFLYVLNGIGRKPPSTRPRRHEDEAGWV